MIENITTVITSLLSAIGGFLTPTSGGEGTLITAAGVAAIGTLFAVPIAIGVGRKALGLVKSMRG